MKIDIAVVNYNTDFYLYNLLRSIRDILPPERIGEVHIWDNGSSDLSGPMMEKLTGEDPRLRFHPSPSNLYHGPALDRLLRNHCSRQWVLVLDSDTEIRKDFFPALPDLDPAGSAFIGQVAPAINQFYIYLFYLLVNRPWYLRLPPFKHHGAPGIDLFRHVSENRIPFIRFNWSRYIEHFGQGSLRVIYEKGETGNQFYEFARKETLNEPKSAERERMEGRLKQRLLDFMGDRTGQVSPGLPDQEVSPGQPRERPRTGLLRLRSALGRLPGAGLLRAFIRSHLISERERLLREACGIGMTQKKDEITRLFQMVREMRPDRVLEIGTSYGGTFFLWTRISTETATLISLDLPPWELDDPWEKRKLALFRSFGRRGQSLHFIRDDSHLDRSIKKVRDLLGNEKLDFLFIDGDHSLDGVRRDFEDYSPLVREGGLIAFHDIHPHSRNWGGEVPLFWQEIRGSHRSMELIEDRQQDGFGIGVIRWR